MTKEARDIQFEIQYLLSLTVAVLGVLSINEVSTVIDVWVGYIFLVIVFTHLVIFNIFYTYGPAMGTNLNYVDRVGAKSRWVWMLITPGFLFFVLHSISGYLHSIFNNCVFDMSILVPEYLFPVPCDNGKTLIIHGIPLTIVVLLSAWFGHKIRPAAQALRDIRVRVVPDQVRILSETRDTEPLLIKVENEGSNNYAFTTKVLLPDQVTAVYDHNTIQSELADSFEVKPGRKKEYNLGLAYDGDQMKSDLIEVSIEHEGGDIGREIEVLLVPQ